MNAYPIIWKTGETGKIRAEDVIAMANVPLYFLQEAGLLPDGVKKFNRVNLYSSKGQCVNFFNEVISNPAALHKLEAEDNDHVYYIESTDEIVFLSQDGYIRTYFKCGGRDYFDRQ